MTSGIRSATVRHIALVLTVLASCSSTQAVPDREIKVAFFEDLSVPEHVDLVSPSFLAFEMVVRRRLDDSDIAVEVVQLDTGGDAGAAVAMALEVAADPRFVLAVAAPFWREPAEVARVLASAGVPTISLSPDSSSPWRQDAAPPGDPLELWRRLVPDRRAEAALLADLAARRTPEGDPEQVCLVSDDSPYGAQLLREIDARLGVWPSTTIDDVAAPAAAADVASSGCAVVVWGGFPPGARDLARAMRESGSNRGRPVDLAGAALKTTVPPTSPAGDGVVVGSVACPCADVTLELGLASRRFVNAYQSEHGVAPGVYAAEGWDAGRIASAAMAAGAVDRAGMRASVRALVGFEGVARAYAFAPDGDLVAARAGLFVAAGTRWLLLPS